MRKIMIAAAAVLASGAMAVPAAAQQQQGLVNVALGDVSVQVGDILSRNNVKVAIPVSASTIVQVPIGLAANVCGTTVALLSNATTGSGAACTASTEQTNQGEATALARALQRQTRRAN